MNPLIELQQAGQSIWLDFITRQFIAEGKLKALIDNDGLRGVTSNPTIFQKAVTGGSEYDAQIQQGIEAGKKSNAIFEDLAVLDIQKACDAFAGCIKPPRGMTALSRSKSNPIWRGIPRAPSKKPAGFGPA
jgi:hypothetical protein